MDAVVVYFDKEDIYIVFFGLSKEEESLLKDSGIIIDYHYQDQVHLSNFAWDKEKWEEMTPERQEELTKDWEEREELWGRVIGGGPFYENGLIFEFLPSGYQMTLMCKKILGQPYHCYCDSKVVSGKKGKKGNDLCDICGGI